MGQTILGLDEEAIKEIVREAISGHSTLLEVENAIKKAFTEEPAFMIQRGSSRRSFGILLTNPNTGGIIIFSISP